jgi:hypothetical protein
MAGASIVEAASAAGSRIGRYFNIVSAIPSALLVLFVFCLVASGAWRGPPDVDAAARAISGLRVGDVALLVVAALALGLFTHPLQFAVVRLLEGYWGTGRLARELAVRRIRRHRERARELFRIGGGQAARLQAVRDSDPELLDLPAGDALMPGAVDAQEFGLASDGYPRDDGRILPTRLGNMLRRYEDLAGSQYGLNAIAIAPHITLVAATEHTEYLRAMREQLDLAVRLCTLSLLATVIAVAFLITDGAWLLVALLPYALAYAAYRGAVIAAFHQGSALATVIDLNRFALYEQLHARTPDTTAEERTMNETLVRLLSFDPTASMSYQHPGDASLDVALRIADTGAAGDASTARPPS